MALLSIIVPVYNNSEADIKRCISSLERGIHINKDIEIIIVDDGSSVYCAQFLDSIKAEKSNIILLHTKNRGVSAARNTGVDVANGRYITFVDADDMVTSNFISDAMFLLNDSDQDFDVIYGFIEYIEDSTKRDLFHIIYNDDLKLKITPLTNTEVERLYCHHLDAEQDLFIDKNHYVCQGPVARLIKKELAVRHRFNERMNMGEDIAWNLSLLNETKKVGIIKRVWYYYIKNTNSATQTYNLKSIWQYSTMVRYLTEFATTYDTKVSLAKKTMYVLSDLAREYYLTEKYQGGFFSAIRDFHQLILQEPWNKVISFRYVIQAGWKCFLKYLLLKSRLFLFFYRLKMLLII